MNNDTLSSVISGLQQQITALLGATKTIAKLVEAQAKHIEHLQERVKKLEDRTVAHLSSHEGR